jgi:hypothetical protein
MRKYSQSELASWSIGTLDFLLNSKINAACITWKLKTQSYIYLTGLKSWKTLCSTMFPGFSSDHKTGWQINRRDCQFSEQLFNMLHLYIKRNEIKNSIMFTGDRVENHSNFFHVFRKCNFNNMLIFSTAVYLYQTVAERLLNGLGKWRIFVIVRKANWVYLTVYNEIMAWSD